MIRVNLLPIKEARRRSAGRAQLLIFAVLILLELGVFAVVWMAEKNELAELEEDVATNKEKKEAAEEEVADIEQLKEDKESLQEKVDVLEELEQRRTGPVRVLDELKVMLTEPRNEAERRIQHKELGWNPDWNPERLWLADLTEEGGSFELQGYALKLDDVAQFLERLTTSDFFIEPDLVYVRATTEDDVRMVEFSITGELSYAVEAADDDDGGEDS